MAFIESLRKLALGQPGSRSQVPCRSQQASSGRAGGPLAISALGAGHLYAKTISIGRLQSQSRVQVARKALDRSRFVGGQATRSARPLALYASRGLAARRCGLVIFCVLPSAKSLGNRNRRRRRLTLIRPSLITLWPLMMLTLMMMDSRLSSSELPN